MDVALLDSLFAFQLGDEVTHKGMRTPFALIAGREAEPMAPQKFWVVQRRLDHCVGGTQCAYACRGLIPSAFRDTSALTERVFWLNESELELYRLPATTDEGPTP